MTNFRRDLEIIIRETGTTLGTIRWSIVYPDNKKFETTAVEALDLQQGAMNVLKRNGIETLGKLMEMWDKLKDCQSCGVVKAKQIKNAFLAYYYDTLTEDKQKAFWMRSLA